MQINKNINLNIEYSFENINNDLIFLSLHLKIGNIINKNKEIICSFLDLNNYLNEPKLKFPSEEIQNYYDNSFILNNNSISNINKNGYDLDNLDVLIKSNPILNLTNYIKVKNNNEGNIYYLLDLLFNEPNSNRFKGIFDFNDNCIYYQPKIKLPRLNSNSWNFNNNQKYNINKFLDNLLIFQESTNFKNFYSNENSTIFDRNMVDDIKYDLQPKTHDKDNFSAHELNQFISKSMDINIKDINPINYNQSYKMALSVTKKIDETFNLIDQDILTLSSLILFKLENFDKKINFDILDLFPDEKIIIDKIFLNDNLNNSLENRITTKNIKKPKL